jgi:HK97 gp10 family phage protein
MPLRSRIPQIIVTLPPAVRAAVMIGAEQVSQDAKRRVPVDTGRLQEAIHVREVPGGAEVVAGDRVAWYGMLVEHGTVVPGHPPRPFLIPAFEENRAAIEVEVDKAIREACR